MISRTGNFKQGEANKERPYTKNWFPCSDVTTVTLQAQELHRDIGVYMETYRFGLAQ